MTEPGAPVLLYDGVCGFCNSAVHFILRHETLNTLRFAPLQGQYAATLKGRHPEVGDVDSVVWVEGVGADERVLVRSNAALRVASYLGGFWKLWGVFRLVPRVVRDFGYDWFARHRYRWFGKYTTCPVPTSDVRSRFLD
jgi:predicted DCC family thiol-disulfide oxidoreductase YuxK